MSNDDIIREELDSIMMDIIEVYEKSGKKVSGGFKDGLSTVYGKNTGTLKGYVYLAGRKAGKMPPVKAIEQWLKRKGIGALKNNISIRSLAFVIARKIGEQGTAKENELKIYEEVITPERINQIIDRITVLNANRIVTEIRAELEVLAKNV